MAEPQFYLQITDANGQPLTSPARPLKQRHGSLDLPLIEACTAAILPLAEAAILAEGVGYMKSEAHVLAAIRAGLPTAIREGMAAAIQTLKDDFAFLVQPHN